jgi:hypothetical protein
MIETACSTPRKVTRPPGRPPCRPDSQTGTYHEHAGAVTRGPPHTLATHLPIRKKVPTSTSMPWWRRGRRRRSCRHRPLKARRRRDGRRLDRRGPACGRRGPEWTLRPVAILASSLAGSVVPQGQRKLLKLVGFFRGNAASSVQLRRSWRPRPPAPTLSRSGSRTRSRPQVPASCAPPARYPIQCAAVSAPPRSTQSTLTGPRTDHCGARDGSTWFD